MIARLAALAAALVLLALPASGQAQAFPARAIRIVVPAGAGGAADLLARAVGEAMGAALGTSVVIENRGGAGGIIGADAVAKAAPDGHTLLVTSNTLVIAPALYKVPYDTEKDFAPVGLMATAPNLLVASADLGVKTLADLIALARREAGRLAYGSPAVGSAAHLTVEMLARAAGIRLTHVPFKGPQQAIMETIAGRVPITIAGVSNALPHLKAGKLIGLAVAGDERSRLVPGVPTFAVAGVWGVYAALWFAMLAPAATPRPVLDRLNVQLNAALKAPEVQARLDALGFDATGGPAQRLGDAMRREIPFYAAVVRDAGIKVE
ncbi:MAG: tripartite tricarboxylate transporter substrate binding protein [Burkholderiales bacterium]|nr:tripartite tricarboxylate transporter substrate binding protein [Burkholderiales bacterium]